PIITLSHAHLSGMRKPKIHYTTIIACSGIPKTLLSLMIPCLCLSGMGREFYSIPSARSV
ncbi:hypothetical protein, partial [Bacteroides heparinolyticus]|uniref:hypothetical protein n=1 Tax=Prevotella heparinolytica TaxID=28113 RepID=UPI0035A1BF78